MKKKKRLIVDDEFDPKNIDFNQREEKLKRNKLMRRIKKRNER